MLARSSKLRHPSGIVLETPLLVPSFSSKGFPVEKGGRSQVSLALKITSEALTESMLISAFDIHHKYIPHPKKFTVAPQITFVDSGGYETSQAFDFSAVSRNPFPIDQEWNELKLAATLDTWPERLPAAFVNFDHGSVRKPLKNQVDDARRFFARYPKHLSVFIMKPETKRQQYVQVPSILGRARELRHFDIIGITEKELGNSILERMENVARIRQALTQASVEAPIHVFGSLDPLTSCLYFLAGAEIFDGLTWLRYTYLGGASVYTHEFGALNVGIHERDALVRDMALMNNLFYLRRLQHEMRAFLLEFNFGQFSHHADLLERSYDSLCATLGGRQ